MRIAMIGQKGVPSRSGGVERHVDDLVRRLRTSEHRIFVYCRKSYVLSETLSAPYFGASRIWIPTVRSKYFETVIHAFLSTLHALFLRIDVFHFHGIGPALFAWIPRVFRPSANVILTFHCQDYFHQKWGPVARLAFRIGELIGCTVSHRIIAVSRLLETYVAETYGREAVYIPNAVTVSSGSSHRQDPETLRRLRLQPNGYILSVSRLIPHKGIHTIIKAYLELAQEIGAMPPLIIAGESSYTDGYAAELRRLAIENPFICFIGEQKRSALSELYANARVFIHASETEGLSYTLLEAMSHGCPVIVSDIAENREVLPSIGITFKNRNAKDLKRALASFLESASNTERNRAFYQEHVQRNYNFEDSFQRSSQLYQSLVS